MCVCFIKILFTGIFCMCRRHFPDTSHNTSLLTGCPGFYYVMIYVYFNETNELLRNPIKAYLQIFIFNIVTIKEQTCTNVILI